MCFQPDSREGANDSTPPPREAGQRERRREQGERRCAQQRGRPVRAAAPAHAGVQQEERTPEERADHAQSNLKRPRRHAQR